jgi:hypothetical protein
MKLIHGVHRLLIPYLDRRFGIEAVTVAGSHRKGSRAQNMNAIGR